MTPVAEAFSVGEFIAEELEARGWSTRDCARLMGGNIDINELTIDLWLHLKDPQMILSRETADGLERAFGVTSETWLNLDIAWREWVKLQGEEEPLF